jgi:hypothetical protein
MSDFKQLFRVGACIETMNSGEPSPRTSPIGPERLAGGWVVIGSGRVVHVLGLTFAIIAVAGALFGQEPSPSSIHSWQGAAYTNYRVASVPWSIHVVAVERTNSLYAIHSLHARDRALGLDTLEDQIALLKPALGTPVAAINGDFYQRDKAYAGAPRGVQIADGELISAPSGGGSFWIDVLGEPHVADVVSLCQITWPDGTMTPFGLNGARPANGVELYTPAVGLSTHTVGGRELILSRVESGPWLPMRIGRPCLARVSAIRETGNSPLAPDCLVLSLGPAASRRLPPIQAGAVLKLSPASLPTLHGARSAMGGGPVLLQGGRRQKTHPFSSESYEFTSMLERHPRTAIVWN